MENREPSSNFKALLQVADNENTLYRDKYILCLAYLPTIRSDIQFLFNDLSEEVPKKKEKPKNQTILIISKIFSKRKVADFNFSPEELISMIKSLILIKQKLSSFNFLKDYLQVLHPLLSLIKNNHGMLATFRGYMDLSINREVVYSIFAMNFDEIRQEAFYIIVKDNDIHLQSHPLLFAFSNVISSYQNFNNIPEQNMKQYLDLQRIVNGLMAFYQSTPIDQPNTNSNSKTVSNYNPTNDKFILYFLLAIQRFYPPYQVTSLDKDFIKTFLDLMKLNDPVINNLIAKLMAAMPATDENKSFSKDSQISVFLVKMTLHVHEFESAFSQNILKFARERSDAKLFIETMSNMLLFPERYKAAVYIGLQTNMFSMGKFISGCFPAKVTNPAFFEPMLNSIIFLLEKSFIQVTNVSTVLTSVFSILSNKNDNYQPILDLSLKAFQLMIDANLTKYVYFKTADSICEIQTNCLIPVLQLLINNKDNVPDMESRKNYYKCVAAIAQLIELEYITDQEKLILLNFLNVANHLEISKPPESNVENERNYWKNMQNKFTILHIMKDYVYSNQDQNPGNYMEEFNSVVSSLFEQYPKYAVVVSLLQSNPTTKQTIDNAILTINSEGDKNNFVSFYITRLFISPTETLSQLSTIVKSIDKDKYRLLPCVLDLIWKLSQLLTSSDVYIEYTTFNHRNTDKEKEQKEKECESIYKSLGKYLDSMKYYRNEKVFDRVQIESRRAVLEAARNPNVQLTDPFIKDMISIPFFFNSYSYLLRKLKSANNSDATAVAMAWVNHLKHRDHDHCFNKEIAIEIISTIPGDDKQKMITSIVSKLISDLKYDDDDLESKDAFSNNDVKAIPIINFLEELAINGSFKTYAYSDKDPKIILFFARFCFSKDDTVRQSAFRFILNYFVVSFPFTDPNSDPQNADPLVFYREKQTRADRALVFLSLFERVFFGQKTLSKEVFELITKKKANIYHILLCKAIVLTNYVSKKNKLNYNLNIDMDEVNNNMYNYNYNNYHPHPHMNRPRVIQNPIPNPNVNVNVNANLNSNNVPNENYDSNSQFSNDDVIPNSVLYAFSNMTFQTAKVSFEAQEVMKKIASKDIDKFIHFLMKYKSNPFISSVVRKIMYSTKLRDRFIDSFICYILRGHIRADSKETLNENDLKVTDYEISFLDSILTSDNSGELVYLNNGKLLLIITLLVGISNRSKERTKLKNNTKLTEIITLITSSNYANKKQIDIQPRLLQMNTDNDENFSESLSEIANEVMNLDTMRFREFCVCCKNSVKKGINCVIYSIGILMIHIGSAFSRYRSATAITMKNMVWSITAEAILKSNKENPRELRLFAHELNKLTDPIIHDIALVNKDHMLVSILDALSRPLDSYKADSVELICRLIEYRKDIDEELAKNIIENLKRSFNLTTKERDQIPKLREKEKEKAMNPQIIEKEEKPNMLIKLFSKSKSRTNEKDKNTEYNPNTPKLDQKVLSALIKLVTISAPSRSILFGDWKRTKLSNVDIAELIVKGNQLEQQLAINLFMVLYNVQTPEDVVKKFILMFSKDDFNELCERLIYVDINRIDQEWLNLLIWLYQSFKNYQDIDPALKQRLFSLSLEISCTNAHPCRELALQALTVFSK